VKKLDFHSFDLVFGQNYTKEPEFIVSLYRVVQKKILLETIDSFVVSGNFCEPLCTMALLISKLSNVTI